MLVALAQILPNHLTPLTIFIWRDRRAFHLPILLLLHVAPALFLGPHGPHVPVSVKDPHQHSAVMSEAAELNAAPCC